MDASHFIHPFISWWTLDCFYFWVIMNDASVNISVQFSHSVVSDSLRPHGLQHARLPCPSPTPGACSKSCPLSRWCHPTISSSVVPFCSCPQSFPASGSFPMSQFFSSGGQSIGASASASVLPVSIQDWSPLGGCFSVDIYFHFPWVCESSGDFMFNIVKNYQTVFQSGYTGLLSCQQIMVLHLLTNICYYLYYFY